MAFEDLTEIPEIVIGIFITKPTPFLEEFFQKVALLDYDKAKITLFIYNNAEFHVNHVEAFLKAEKDKYKSVVVSTPKDHLKEWHARNKGLTMCQEVKCDFYFSIDSEAHIDNDQTLKLLIEQNRNVIAPLLIRPYKAWSNFWGALTSEGYYAR